MRIGVDFDNTIVCYDEAFLEVAKQKKLINTELGYTSKTAVRDAVRALPDGEYQWQCLQGLVYGRLIMHARLFDGVDKFFAYAGNSPDIELYIVSHKTEIAHHDELKTNLRSSALNFLEHNGFFDRLNLQRSHVFFESTREEKIARIKDIGCDVFIDDLPEVLLDPYFPANCRPIFFSSAPEHGLANFSSWNQIQCFLIP